MNENEELFDQLDENLLYEQLQPGLTGGQNQRWANLAQNPDDMAYMLQVGESEEEEVVESVEMEESQEHTTLQGNQFIAGKYPMVTIDIVVTEDLWVKGYNAYQTNLIIYSRILGETQAAEFLWKYREKNKKTITWKSKFKRFQELKVGTHKRFVVDTKSIVEILGEGYAGGGDAINETLSQLNHKHAIDYLREKTLKSTGEVKNLPIQTRLLYISMAKKIDEFSDEEWKKYEDYKNSKTNTVETFDLSAVYKAFLKYYSKNILPKKKKKPKKEIYHPKGLKNPFKASLFHTPASEQLIYTYHRHPKEGHLISEGAYGIYIVVLKLALNEVMKDNPMYKPLTVNQKFDSKMLARVKAFQMIFEANKGQKGIIGPETLKQLDKVLFNKRSTRGIINEDGLIGNVAGATLYVDASEKSQAIGKIDLSGRVLVLEEPYLGWYKVAFAGDKAPRRGGFLTESKQGYLKASDVELSIGPDKQVKLHEVKESNLESIINTTYKPNTDRDRSFYANAILFYNQNYGKGAVYVTDAKGKKIPFDKKKEEVDYSYKRIHVQANARIWLPSNKYTKYLKKSGEVFSASKGAQVRKAFENVGNRISKLLDMLLPEGGGIYLEGELGVTAFSIGADLEGGFYIYRKGDALMVERRAIMKAGLDVGAGGGFFVGTRPRSKGGRHGLGAEAGVNASIKAKSILFQTYVFNLKNAKEMLPALLVMFNYDDKQDPKYLLILFFSHLAKLGLNTDDYLIKSKMGVGAEARAAASAGIGARTGDENMKPKNYGKLNYADNRQGDKYRGLSKESLLQFINLQAGVNIGAEGLAGIETEYADAKGNPVRNKEADFMLINVYQELKLEAGVGIPWLVYLFKPSTLPLMLLPKVVGAGLKQKFKWDLEKKTVEHVNNAVYLQTGEIDYYVGNASEIEIDISKEDGYGDLINAFMPDKGKSFDDTFKQFRNVVSQIQIKKRVGYPIPVLHRGQVHKKQYKYNTTKRLLKQKPSRSAGSKVMAFLTFNFQLNQDDLDKLKQKIMNAITNIQKSDKDYDKNSTGIVGYIWQKIIQFVTTGKVPDSMADILGYLFSDKIIQSADLMIQAGLSLGGGAKAGAAVKFRAQAFGSAGFIYTSDITQAAKQAVLELNNSKDKSFFKIFTDVFSVDEADIQSTTQNAQTKDHITNTKK